MDESLALLQDGAELRELVGRLAARHHNNVWSADAELFFAGYCAKQGYNVDLHPLQVNNKRPEFRASKGREKFLLEVRSLVPPGTDTIEGELRSYLEEHAESVLGNAPIHAEVEPLATVSGSLPKRQLFAAFRNCYKRYSGGLGDEFIETIGGVAFKFKFADFGGGGPSIGWSKGAGRIDELERIREAIEKKGSRYGKPKEPFVIVVDSQDWFRVNTEQLNWALYGTHVIHFMVPVFGTTNPVTQSQTTRTKDGIFRADKNTRISAVIYHRAFWRQDIWEHMVVVYHNAFATHPFPEQVFKGFPQFAVRADSPDQGHYEWIDGKGDSF